VTAGLRFGVCLPQFTTDPAVSLRAARDAEDAGYDAVSLFDHLTPLGGPPGRPILECLTTLTWIAARTERITVLPLVLRAGLRPPATAAAAFRDLARLAPGRVVCAIGAGDWHNEQEDLSVGLPARTQAERQADVIGLVDVLRADVPGVPVWVGGAGARMRRIAGELADGWNIWGADPETVQSGAADVTRAANAAGRPAPVVSWGGQVVLAPSAAEAETRLATWGAGRPPAALAGVLRGDPDGVALGLAALAAAGASTFLLSFVGEGAAAARLEFARLVAPGLRAARPV
jgi:alkanesulfonate monooxygenase SsuD/methylene tetrahydromethanopterin reductase-like flavin-dependent oxidoreductase (luciferase family)